MEDLIIIGGGPTGLGTAIMAARAGLQTTVFEPHSGIIDKACGEGLMPGAVALLSELGVQPEFSHPFIGVRYRGANGVAEGRFPNGPGLGVRRTVLHRALLERATELGVRIRHERVGPLQQEPDHVSVNGLDARWVFAADGLYSGVRKQLGLAKPPKLPARYGLRRHYQQAPWSEFVEVYWAEDAEAYVTPVGEDLIGVAVLFGGEPLPPGPGSEARYLEVLNRFPDLSERLTTPCTSVRGSGPFERRLSRRREGRVLLIGDAGGYLDPITGEGIRLGLATGGAALDCILKDRPQDYDRAWSRATRNYWLLTEGLLRLRGRPFSRKLMIPFLQTIPGSFSRIVSILAA